MRAHPRWRRLPPVRYPRTAPGRMPERPKGAVCKIAGVAYGGSNPPPPTDRWVFSKLRPLTSQNSAEEGIDRCSARSRVGWRRGRRRSARGTGVERADAERRRSQRRRSSKSLHGRSLLVRLPSDPVPASPSGRPVEGAIRPAHGGSNASLPRLAGAVTWGREVR